MQYITRIITTKDSWKRAAFAATAVLVAVVISFQPLSAANYQQRINQLEQEVSHYADKVDHLQVRGETLEDALANLRSRINTLQQRIAENQAERRQLTRKIQEAKQEIQHHEELIAHVLRKMYIKSQIGSLEMVASSGSISEYLDKQQYRNSLQQKIKQGLEKIEALKKKLEKRKRKVEHLIQKDRALKREIAAQKAVKARLLEKTHGKEQKYQQLIDKKQEKIEELEAKLQAKLAAAAAQSGSHVISWSGTDSYPWANAPFPSTFSCSGVDPWGMCYRQCVSYVAWKVASTGRHVPYGLGNANMWDDNARALGIPVGTEPRVGAVAINDFYPYGHAMYVEAVIDGGSKIIVSEYNYNLDGTYTKRVRSAAGLEYIYF